MSRGNFISKPRAEMIFDLVNGLDMVNEQIKMYQELQTRVATLLKAAIAEQCLELAIPEDVALILDIEGDSVVVNTIDAES